MTKAEGRRRPHFNLRAFPALVLLAALVPVGAAAQPVAAVERKLLPFRLGPLEPLPSTFWAGLTFLRDEEDRQRSLKADISFGLSGDEAGERSLFKLNTGISLSRGVFPTEVSVVMKLFLQQRDGQLQEDVTSLQITYDYHTTHHVEYFAFAERFTDSFMSVQQRYEVGFGARAGFRWGRLDGRGTDAHFAAVRDGLPAVEAAMPAVRAAMRARPQPQVAGLQEVTPPELEQFRTAVDNIQAALSYKDARVFLGLAASIFAEIENAQLEVSSLPIDGSSSVPLRNRISLTSQQRYRLSLRPTLRLRPSADVSIAIFPYFKLPLDGPVHVILRDGRRQLDYRRDVFGEFSWTIRREQTGLENVDFVFSFNDYYDNVPPTLSDAVIAETLAAGRVFTQTVAESRHRVMALALKLRW